MAPIFIFCLVAAAQIRCSCATGCTALKTRKTMLSMARCANEPLRCTPKRKTKTLDVKLTPSKAIEGIDADTLALLRRLIYINMLHIKIPPDPERGTAPSRAEGNAPTFG